MPWLAKALAVVLAAAAASPGWAQLNEIEQQAVDDALSIAGLRRSDFSYDRYAFPKPRMLPVVDLGISSPFDSASNLMRLHASAQGSPVQIAERAAREVLGSPGKYSLQSGIPITPEAYAGLPPALRAPILRLGSALVQCDLMIRSSQTSLTPEELRTLIEGLPRLAVEEPKVAFEFVRQPMPSRSELLELLGRADIGAIQDAGVLLLREVEAAVASLKLVGLDLARPVRFSVGRMVIEVAGRGNDIHTSTDARLVIDLGGDDTYAGRAGAGVGYAAVLIDLGGDDRVRPRDLSVGAAVLGAGIAWFEGGNDTFDTGSLALGAGIGGVGAFVKQGGNDQYRSKTLAQGFGQWGLGLCLDTGGDDTYALQLFGQGAARTDGAGWLVDQEGRDQYRAGGLVLNSPLFTTAHYSFAQGFGMGYREDSGGIPGGAGLLTDLKGDDAYLGETYQQAASYWMGLGSLYDAEGNDTYSGHHYCQSSSMHLSASYLFDLAGDDAYVVRVGAAHAIGHDYGTAFLFDRAGDDNYASRDSNPSVGTANGAAIFIDGGGIDRYGGPSAQANASRGTGSLALFVDLGGADLYRTGLEDGAAVLRPSWGAAYDAASPAAAQAPAAPPAWPEIGSQPDPGPEELARLYTEASRWGVGSAQESVRAALEKLIAIGLPAWKWVLENRLAGADRLQMRALTAMAQQQKEEGRQLLAARLGTASGTELSNALRLCADARIVEAGPLLPALIARPETRLIAMGAAGSLKVVEAIPALVEAAKAGGLPARSAMVALSAIGHKDGLPLALALAAGSDPLTRRAAIGLLAQHPDAALAAATELLADADEVRARAGVQIAGAAGTAAGLALAGASLQDPRPGVRIEALVQLAGRCPDAFVEAFNAAKTDPFPTVAAVAKRLNARP